jgi:hydroxymethylbilane synthase
VSPGEPLRIGSRASALARAQAEWVAERVPGPAVLVWIRSEGDEAPARDLGRFDAPGIFTRALHRALAEGRIDAAVHSLKDLPVEDEPGTLLACVPGREDPRDALVARDGLTLARLPAGARVGTGSPRRICEVRRLRPDLEVVALRGNVDSRIERVRRGGIDAVLLAVAGLRRLGREDEATEVFDPESMLPAAAQGALGLTIRAGDANAEARLAPLRDIRAAAAVTAERAAVRSLGAGCHGPVGALATVEAGRLRLRVRVGSRTPGGTLEETGEGALAEAAAVGRAVAARLLARGAATLLEPT